LFRKGGINEDSRYQSVCIRSCQALVQMTETMFEGKYDAYVNWTRDENLFNLHDPAVIIVLQHVAATKIRDVLGLPAQKLSWLLAPKMCEQCWAKAMLVWPRSKSETNHCGLAGRRRDRVSKCKQMIHLPGSVITRWLRNQGWSRWIHVLQIVCKHFSSLHHICYQLFAISKASGIQSKS